MALLLIVGPAARAPGEPRDGAALENPIDQIESRVNANDPDGAVALGQQAVERCPDDSALWLALGKAFGAKARVAAVGARLRFAKKCKAAFENAVGLDPKNVDARFALFTYCLEAPGIAGGSVSAAQKQAEEIVKLDAARGHLALGSLGVRRKDYPRAETELRLALEASESNGTRADAECELALLYEKLGKKPEAIDALRNALRLDPENPQVKKDLKRLGG